MLAKFALTLPKWVKLRQAFKKKHSKGALLDFDNSSCDKNYSLNAAILPIIEMINE